MGRYTFVLSDGQRWSARRMKRWHYDLLLQMTGIEHDEPVQMPPAAVET
ncbi:MAG: hypothetical protein GY835_23525 [bacterium]|nr:hypothetical protein [bacterium]